jgi:hypothetical protein
MATHRRYTRTEKAEAVAAATLTNATVAAESLGIPENTLRYWLDQPEFVELRSKTRDEVGERLWSAIQLGIDEVAKGLRSEAPLRDKATAVGILYDKFALLSGGATARSESRDITGTISDSELHAAVLEADRLARARSGDDSSGDQEAPEG